MNKSITVIRKPRGRPATGIGKPVGLRLYPELERALGAYEKAHPERPGHPEAIRQLLTEALTRRGYLKKG